MASSTIPRGSQPKNGPFDFSKEGANMDVLMKWLAQEHPDKLIFSYPNIQGEYDMNLTATDMERLTAFAASRYSESFKKLPNGEVTGDLGFGGLETKIVAMVSISTLSSYISIIALQRLGYSTMLISPRLAENGYAHLLRVTGTHAVVAGATSLELMHRVKKTYEGSMDIVPMLDDEEILAGLNSPHVAWTDCTCYPGIIIHTGGTTGLPKPIACTTKGWMYSVPVVETSPVLCTVPNFHGLGLGSFTRALRSANQLFVLNAKRPVTASIVWKALDATGAQVMYTVPYTLKFFADTEGGIERLAALDHILAGGAATPDELGDKLVRAGVRLTNGYGQTESGITMRAVGSGVGEWSWLSPTPESEKFLRFEKVGQDMYHLVILSGFPSLRISDRPDGSYGTKDIFRPHPDNLPGNDTRAKVAKWKYVARQGDVIVLINGENADPTPIEQNVMLSPYIEMALAFGAGHERLGLLVIPTDKAANMSKTELIKNVVPDLERGNAIAADYAKISPDDIIIKPVGTPYPMTAKMTLQRPIMHKLFAEDIEAHYAAREKADGSVPLSDDEVHGVVRRIVEEEFQKQASVSLPDETDDQSQIDENLDFFSLGMDSLQASHVRGRLLREIPLPKGARLATNVVFDHPNLGLLSDHIKRLRQESDQNGSTARDSETTARAMVKKYVDLVTGADDGVNGATANHEKSASDNFHVVILTGATGSLGAQLLKLLLNRPDVSRVYCLVRTRQAQDHEAATERIRTALDNNLLLDDLTPDSMAKLTCFSTNLAAADLGLRPAEYGEIKASVTSIIHNAWSVNFNMNLESFEPNIASVAHLLKLAKSPIKKDESCAFVFVSSIAAVGGVRSARGAEERFYPDIKEANPFNGYGVSKWVSEQICAEASASARVLRIGQIAGDTEHGVWNPAEAIPAIVQSALTIGALPKMVDAKNTLRWLPSDITAAVITDLTIHPTSERVFHVNSPHTLTWNDDVLPAIEKAGIEVRVVPQGEWVRLLDESDSDIERNPPYKLIEHFRLSYGDIPDGKLPDDREQRNKPMAKLNITQTLKASPSLKDATPVDTALVEKYVRFWLKYWVGEHRKTR
ncbi:hypothetical protein N0V93_006822 [Gnomoniopsis smithogilvyi]|uniref:Carrier domain-containing protein n=1 Tax=Gnomoniopsis smithogilvyi TaxID=1191159 RepID=A0A9W8YSM1_9PEZI|nr:hypothetical protein N0V93_006822 [Gnomoniopsis smithogilvyi]